jgi:ABC-type glycerol-3-phosphate transport system substrate-binding protein
MSEINIIGADFIAENKLYGYFKKILEGQMKKYLIVLVVFAMILTVASCKSEEKKPTIEAKKLTFDGIKITYATPWGKDLTEGQNDETDRLIARIASVEKELNIKFEWIRADGNEFSENMVTRSLSGQNFGQLVFAYPWLFAGWAKAGIAADSLEIAKSVGIDFGDKEWSSVATDMTTYNKKVFGFSKSLPQLNSGVIFNKRLIEEAGLASPYELVKKNTWNFDTLKKYAKALTKVDSNGVTTQYGFSAMNHEQLCEAMIFANGGIDIDTTKKTPKVAFGSEAALEAMSLFQEMALVDKTLKLRLEGEDWEANPKGFADSKIAMMMAEQWIIENVNMRGAEEFGFVYFPKGPKAKDYTCVAGQEYTFIPGNIPKNEQQAALLAYSKIFAPLYPEIPLDEYYSQKSEAYVHDEESANIFADILAKRLFTTGKGMKYSVDSNALFRMLATKSYTPKSAVTEQMPIMEASITDYIG